ncbi:MAG TPA: type I restriction-modification system subunit M N-terminal domain-containing protein [Gemmatimonadales bacterium]|nr:type I restriction-modification system subunit M N-terminal domain-containing protein [Gemmatimonadales bacterium]
MARRGKKSAAAASTGATVGYEAQLWQMADALRGSMDAAEYKHVVLGLIFLKYISDAFEEQHAKLVADKKSGADPEDPDEYRALAIFWVPPEARWSHRVRLANHCTFLTVKIPVGWEHGTRAVWELEQVLEDHEVRRFRQRGALRTGVDVVDHLSGDACHALLDFGVRRLFCAGWARTVRYVLECADLGHVELDLIRLPRGRTLYEAEIEEPDRLIREGLVRFIRELAPSAAPVAISKFWAYPRRTPRGRRGTDAGSRLRPACADLLVGNAS